MEHKSSSSSERKRKKDSKSSSKEASGSKKSESSKDKEDKHGNTRSRHYAYISPESITKIAESIGIPSLNDDIAVNLAEDVSYKLQEIIHTSSSFMRCCKRRKLLTSDVRSALQTCDAPPVYGHDGDDSTKFLIVPEADVYVTQDTEVDLIAAASGSETHSQSKPPNISTSWPILVNPQKTDCSGSSETTTDGKSVFAVPHPKGSVNGEGSTSIKQEPSSGKSSQHVTSANSSKSFTHSPSGKSQSESGHNAERLSSGESTKAGKRLISGGSSNSSQQHHPAKTNGAASFHANSETNNISSSAKSDAKLTSRALSSIDDTHVSATQLSYYNIASDCILRGSDTHFEVVLADLQTNEKLGMLVPYFLNLVAFTINRIPRHYALLKRLLSTVDAILDNQSVNPSYSISVNRVVNALLAVTSDHRILDDVDDFQLRRTAARLLARVFAEWNVENEHVSGLLSQLSLVLGDSSEPVQSHYGALVIFQALGYPVTIDCLAPILHNYLPKLQDMIDQCPPSDHKLAHRLQEVRGVVLTAAESLYCGHEEDQPSNSYCHKILKQYNLDRLLYEHFGDSLCARRRHFPCNDNVLHEVRTDEAYSTSADTQAAESDTFINKRRDLAKTRLCRLKASLQVPNAKRIRTLTSDVFETPLNNAITRRKDIHFTFAGANPVPKERLRRRLLDRTHAQCALYARSPVHSLYSSQSYAMSKQRRGRNAHMFSVGNRLNQCDPNSLLRQF